MKFCKTCESIITNNECSNKNCPDKINKIIDEVEKISKEIGFDNGTITICPRNGNGCITKDIKE